MKLYKSSHFALIDIRTTGKKQVKGVLCFEGLPSVYGNAKAVCALEDGVVISAGRNNDIHSRAHRMGTAVTLTSHDGVTVTYGRLARRTVNVGDYVQRGEVIGYEGSSGSGKESYLLLEFRRNGRRIDGCEYLGIMPKLTVFAPDDIPVAEVVCRACGLTGKMMAYMNLCPEAELMWERIYNKLTSSD